MLTCRARISRLARDGYYSATKKPRETLQILVPVLLDPQGGLRVP